MGSKLKNKLIIMKEDLALKIFESENGTFNDLKNLNFLFDTLLSLIEIFERLFLELRIKILDLRNTNLIYKNGKKEINFENSNSFSIN